MIGPSYPDSDTYVYLTEHNQNVWVPTWTMDIPTVGQTKFSFLLN